jgi:hypothetical protein
MAATLSGGCLCGAVRFEIDEPLGIAGYCHCTRCQRRTGAAASAQALVAPGSLRIVSGEQRIGSYDPPEGFSKLFCRACGSALFARPPGQVEAASVRLGAIDGDPGVTPSYRQFTDYAASWEELPDDGLPRFPERRPTTA